jgi:hypothetical protein
MDDNELKKLSNAIDELEKEIDYIRSWLTYITGSVGLSIILTLIMAFV